MIAVYSPRSGGRPLAIAMASGSATMPTMMPDTMSEVSRRRLTSVE